MLILVLVPRYCSSCSKVFLFLIILLASSIFRLTLLLLRLYRRNCPETLQYCERSYCLTSYSVVLLTLLFPFLLLQLFQQKSILQSL